MQWSRVERICSATLLGAREATGDRVSADTLQLHERSADLGTGGTAARRVFPGENAGVSNPEARNSGSVKWGGTVRQEQEPDRPNHI
jgi:hypothetical protein